MRNLEATSFVSLPPSTPLLADATCFCIDTDSAYVWVVSSAGLCRITPDRQVSVEVPLVDGGHVTSGDYVIGVEHVSDLESVCLATRNGDILLCNTHTCHVDCVGSAEGGLLEMAWSPDQELVVFGTGKGSLLLMTHQLDPSGDMDHELVPVTEIPMSPSEFGEAKPVNVGWGHKSTQFHGSAGKHSAKEQPVRDAGPALTWDDLRPRVSWRGDGEYFVCSCIEPASGRRRLRVWTRDGVLHSTSEETECLEHSLHWRPSGNLITSSQSLSHTHQVVFFERNGLRHGRFSLPQSKQSWQVRQLLWNCDSSVLCLWLEQQQTETAATEDGSVTKTPPTALSSIQLWTSGNYHWYLKQELYSPLTPDSAHSGRPQAIQWDPIVPLRLHVLTTDGCYECYNWRWCVNKSSCLSVNNRCDVAVIDGDRLLLTPLRHTITPPPMSTHTLTLPSSITHITHAPQPHTNDFLIITANREIAIFSYKQTATKGLQPPTLVGTVRLPVNVSLIRQLCWWKSNSVVGVVWDCSAQCDSVVEFGISVDREQGRVEVGPCHSSPLPHPHTSLHSLVSHPHTGTTVAQTTNGTLLSYSTESGLLPRQLLSGAPLRFPDGSCDYIAVVTIEEKDRVVGLNVFRRLLYVDDTKIATGVTTFDLHNEFLIYTTDSHMCCCVSLTSDLCVQPVWNADTPAPLDEGVRRVERGAKIVAVIPHDFKLVLQMPRGNLETIYPRPLVLSTVRRHLDNLRYGDAFVIMRKHRINLNLIYDHNPQMFLTHTRDFVEQLPSVAHINLFLTELRDEDTSVSMYPVSGVRREEGRGRGGEGKVDVVCEAVRKVLVEIDENKYLLSIITSHVKKSVPELEYVLLRIKQLRDGPSQSRLGAPNDVGTERVSAEEGMKYALLLVDVDQLYEVALGMYDFQLVLMVAERSQKDPKEYLPFLNELRRLPPSYQKYRINLHLQRYHKALQHISQCGPEKFEECLSLIKEHSLYTDALDIYTDRSSLEYKTVAQCYGEHLSTNGSHKEAAIIFFQSGCLPRALESFEKAGNWQMTFALSARLGYSVTERMQLARRVAGTLRDQRRYSAAATALLDYANDVEEAVVVLLEGGLWEECLRTVSLHGRQDLIETHIKPQLLEGHEQHLSLLPTLTSSLTRYSQRLQVVCDNKRKKQEAILEGTYAADEKDADLFSDTSSVTGRSLASSLATTGTATSRTSSRTAGKSRKNQRKASHKKWSLREGSRHEDLALLEAITDICGTVDHLQDEVPSLLDMLLMYGHTHEARQLHALFCQLLSNTSTAIHTIWQPQTTPPNYQAPPTTGPGATVNSMLAAMATSSGPSVSQQAQTRDGEDLFPRPKLRDLKWQPILL